MCLHNWFSGGLGNAGSMIALSDLKGLFLHKLFYASMTGSGHSSELGFCTVYE